MRSAISAIGFILLFVIVFWVIGVVAVSPARAVPRQSARESMRQSNFL